MNRRETLRYTAAVMGISILGADAFLAGCTTPGSKDSFTEEDIRLLDEIGETILPASDRSPGAKAAHIGEFMKTIVTDCYTTMDQKIFRDGIDQIRRETQVKYGRPFEEISNAGKVAMLTIFDEQSRQHKREPLHFYTMIKQLTIWGYFSSQPGVTKATRYNPIPGGYDGCVKYEVGDKAWYGPLSSIG